MRIDLIKNISLFSLILISCSLIYNDSLAQDSTARQKHLIDSIEREMDYDFADPTLFQLKSFWLESVNFLSNNVYLGRKDSVPSPYVTESIGYFHKSGLFINASASYLTESGQGRVDLFTIDGGYSLITKKFDGILTVSKYFFSPESYNVRSEIEGSADIFLAYDLGLIKPTLQATLNFGDNTDYTAELGLEHTFYALDRKLRITPTFNLNASTQNYYNNYYKFSRYSLDRRKILKRILGVVTISAYVEDPGQFKIMDYECAIPISYSLKRFTFNFSPTFAMPVNPAITDVTLTSTRLGTTSKVRGKEQLTNSFFFTTGVTYSF
jgi:hypothetical protein